MPSVSKKQQKFMGIVRAIQKGEADPSDFNKDAQDAAKKMKKSSVKKYAKTKHKGLPTKKVSEDKFKKLPGKVVAKRMMSIKSLKPYASMIAKKKSVSTIDLERELPYDKVSVKDIDKVMKESVNESRANVLKAIKIAKKMSGNMTGAVKKIEKIQKGLSKQIEVEDALRQANESINEGRVLHFTQIKDKTLEKHLKVIAKKVGATVSKISGGFKVDADNDGRKLAQVVDYIFDKSLMKGLMSGGGMSRVQLVNEDSGSVIDEGLGDMIGKSIGKYNKKRKKNMDALKKLKKKESVEEAYDIWAEDGSFGYTFTGLVEAEYQGRKVKLGKPMRGDVKKFKVYVKNPKGNVVKVNFGQGKKNPGGTMRIRKSNPKARANFRARHNCDNPGPRHKARYWSCRKW